MHIQKSMRKANGFLFETSLDTGKVREVETCMCGHCNRHVVMWNGQGGTGYWCSHCGKTICDRCAKLGDCSPLEKQLAAALASNLLYRNIKEL